MGGVDTYMTNSGDIVAALNTVWAKIRELHPDTPAAIITFGDGNRARGKLVNGHFASRMWRTEEEGDEVLHEVFIGGEGIQRGAVATLGTLLHEAAHGIAHVREIKDTSRGGRYHNTKFKAIGEELGLELSQDERIGWSRTSVPEATQLLWADEIGALDKVLKVHRLPVVKGAGRSSSNNGVTLECACRKIRLSKSAAELGPITCNSCGEEFEEAV